MNIIRIVTVGRGATYGIVAVFTDCGVAQNYMRKINERSPGTARVELWASDLPEDSEQAVSAGREPPAEDAEKQAETEPGDKA